MFGSQSTETSGAGRGDAEGGARGAAGPGRSSSAVRGALKKLDKEDDDRELDELGGSRRKKSRRVRSGMTSPDSRRRYSDDVDRAELENGAGNDAGTDGISSTIPPRTEWPDQVD